MIGENIRKLRKSYGYTRQVAAQKLGVTPTTIQNWEIGKTEPNLLALKAIAYEYGTTVDYLTSKNGELDSSKITRQCIIQAVNTMSDSDLTAFKKIISIFADIASNN